MWHTDIGIWHYSIMMSCDIVMWLPHDLLWPYTFTSLSCFHSYNSNNNNYYYCWKGITVDASMSPHAVIIMSLCALRLWPQTDLEVVGEARCPESVESWLLPLVWRHRPFTLWSCHGSWLPIGAAIKPIMVSSSRADIMALRPPSQDSDQMSQCTVGVQTRNARVEHIIALVTNNYNLSEWALMCLSVWYAPACMHNNESGISYMYV